MLFSEPFVVLSRELPFLSALQTALKRAFWVYQSLVLISGGERQNDRDREGDTDRKGVIGESLMAL